MIDPDDPDVIVDTLIALGGFGDARREKLAVLLDRPDVSARAAARLVLTHLWYGPHSGSDFEDEITLLLQRLGGLPHRPTDRSFSEPRLLGGRKYPGPFIRASGESICSRCAAPYWKHPHAAEFLSWEGTPYLRRLCDGTLVKL